MNVIAALKSGFLYMTEFIDFFGFLLNGGGRGAGGLHLLENVRAVLVHEVRHEIEVGRHDQYTEIKTYLVTITSDQIEFNRVRYNLSKAEPWKLRLLPLLSLEALEVADTNLPPIVVDSIAARDNRQLLKTANTLENPSCNRGNHFLEHPSTVGEFVVAKVRAIRVLRTAPLRVNFREAEFWPAWLSWRNFRLARQPHMIRFGDENQAELGNWLSTHALLGVPTGPRYRVTSASIASGGAGQRANRTYLITQV